MYPPARIRMLCDSIIARARAATGIPARQAGTQKPNACTRVLWNQHHTRHGHMQCRSSRAGADGRHDNHQRNHRYAPPAMEGGIAAIFLRGWPFCVRYLPGLSGRALLSYSSPAWALSVQSRVLWLPTSHICPPKLPSGDWPAGPVRSFLAPVQCR